MRDAAHNNSEFKKTNSLTSQTIREPLRSIKKRLPLRVLSAKEYARWKDFGYIVVKQAVPYENVERLRNLLWEFQEMDPEDPTSWTGGKFRSHAMQELNNSGMVEIYNHQFLWDNRQTQRVYDAFVDVWDEEHLWVTIDRANLNTPNNGSRSFNGFIHTDVDTTIDPLPVGVQGVLALSDTDEEVGGFQCVPELFHQFDSWRASQRSGRDGFKPDVTGYDIEPISLKAGDLLIFNSLLAHGIRPNMSSKKVRSAQYIAMSPANPYSLDLLEQRISSWMDRVAPQGHAFPGDPRELERKSYETAVLTPLGRKLLGLDSW
jgi:ectoine hydroxylase-related dioxygenase (phytanoyl-CoA dioxygenase family)